jgi:hypothetical protein
MTIKYKLNGYEGEAVFYENEIIAPEYIRNIYGTKKILNEKQGQKYIANETEKRIKKQEQFFKMVEVLKKKNLLWDYQIIN